LRGLPGESQQRAGTTFGEVLGPYYERRRSQRDSKNTAGRW